MRRSIFIGLGVVAVVAGAMIAAVLLLPAERVGTWAAARASAVLAREVRVERFGVRLFPRPAVALEGVSIGGATAAEPVFASADRVELKPRLLPLLRRRVVIDEIALERPQLRIDIAADSTSNIPSFGGAADSAAEGDAELSIRRLRVRNGTLVYHDATTGTAARIGGITHQLKLSGSIADGGLKQVSAAGDLTLLDIDVDAPALLAWPLRDLRLRVEHDINVDRTADRVDLTRLTITLQEVALDITGSVTGMTDSLARSVDLRAQSASTDVAELIASLPQSLLENSDGDLLTGAAGRAGIDVTVRGRTGAGAVPVVAGVLSIEGGALARGRHGTIADELNGRIAFSLDSIASDGITGRVLGESLHIAFDLRDPSAPHGHVRARAALKLTEAKKLGLLPDSVQAGGRIAVDVSAAGSLVEPAEALLGGYVDLTGVQLQVASLERPVVVQHGRIVLDGRTASAKGLRAVIGASDVAVDFAASEWLPYALGDTLRPPVITFDARSTRFDADEIFGAQPASHTYGQLFFARLADRPLDGRSAAEAAEAAGLGMPELPPVTLDGRIRATRFVRGAVPFNDVDVTIAARAGELDVRAASFRMMGGGVHMTGRLGLAAAGAEGAAAQPLALDYTISDVAAAEFLQRFTNFRDHMTGDLLIAGTMSMLLDEHLLPVRTSVTGAGTLAVLEGEIVNWPLLLRLGDRIGAAKFDTLAFRDWTGRYRITGPKVVLEESMLESGELGVRAAGSFDVDGTLDLGATLYMPQSWAARVPGAPAALLASAAAAEDGRVPVGARFTGTAREPAIAVDMSEAGVRIANNAREAARQQAREAAARAAGSVADRLLPPRDSVSASADSAKKKVEAEVVNRLRRVIRPGGV